MNQKKIAQLAHVSPSTVSKALHGNRDVSAELAEKIRQIAIENGYLKEKSERKLSNLRQKKPLIAIFCPEIISVYYSHNVTLIKNEIESLGGESFVCIYDFSDEKLDQMLESLIMRNGCDAIIAVGSRASAADDMHLPIAYVDIRNARDIGEVLCYNADGMMELAVNHLLEVGCKRIGYMGEALTHSKQVAFIKALQKANAPLYEELIYTSDKRFEYAGFDCANQLLASAHHPDGIVAAYDEIALGAMHVLSKNNVQIPKDIAFVGINNIPFAAYAGTGLTSIKTFSEERCAEAIKALFQSISDGNRTPYLLHTEPELIVRDSSKR